MIVLAILIALVCAALMLPALYPLWRKNDGDLVEAADQARMLYRDQLHEIDTSDRFDAHEKQLAHTEVSRRLLRLEKHSSPMATESGAPLWLTWTILGTVPIASLFLYLMLGRPDLVGGMPKVTEHAFQTAPPPSQTERSDQKAPEDNSSPSLRDKAAQLQDRIESEPDNPYLWIRLAREQLAHGDANASSLSFMQAVATAREYQKPVQDVRLAALEGLALTVSQMDQEHLALLRNFIDETLSENPNSFLGLYVGGLAARMQGDKVREQELMNRLDQLVPADAPIREILNQELR